MSDREVDRIRASLARMDEPAWTRDPEPPTVGEDAAEILAAHQLHIDGRWCTGCDWTSPPGRTRTAFAHAEHVVALLRTAGCLADPGPVLLLTPAPGVVLTREQQDEIAALGRRTLGTSTGAGGTPGASQ